MQQRTVHLFVFDTLADWEPSFAIAGINSPSVSPTTVSYRVQTVGLDRTPVRTMGGVTILPDLALSELEPAESAMLILPGSDRWEEGELSEVFPLVARFIDADVPVAAICGATIGLARGGFLDTVRHTSNDRSVLEATGYQGVAHYQDAPVVADGPVITAAGTAALEFAALIFRQLGVYSDAMTDAWYALFKTGDPAHFVRMQQLAAAE
jgi:putative intracellular protease/amidase